MRPGPAPEPTALKVLKGSHHMTKQAEMKAPPGMPRRPSWLNRTAQREWDRVVPILDAAGILTEADGDALAAYCSAVALMAQASRIVYHKGLTITTPTGQVKTRPEVHILQSAMRQVRALACEFGLTPSARSRIEVPDDDRDDDLPGGIR